MNIKTNKRILAIILALIVTFLWSTSFIIIKKGLSEIPPILYAGLRYFLAFITLLFLLLNKKYKEQIINLTKKDWVELSALGVVFYALTQGMQFLGLYYLPAVWVSLVLNFTPLIVAMFGFLFLNEKPLITQWFGVILFIVGVLVYFLPLNVNGAAIIGIIIMGLGTVFNAISAVLGRYINRRGHISPVVTTIISMGIGSSIMLITGLSVYEFPAISSNGIIYLLWLAIINTALAFTLWNYSLVYLNAVESSIINGTMLIQIAVLAYFFLGETITLKELGGMLIAVIGALFVQLKNIKVNFNNKNI
ncbi:MAG TPA: DMT family transporter [Melioribacteraceae bacterium]|nr:DMT family transporter [Melioribacteraceae bacterium]